jgi:hypothetical protein
VELSEAKGLGRGLGSCIVDVVLLLWADNVEIVPCCEIRDAIEATVVNVGGDQQLGPSSWPSADGERRLEISR